MMPSGLTSMSSGSIGASSAFAASGENASRERPWNERCQSTGPLPSSTTRFWSLRPEVRSDVSDELVSAD